MAVADQEDEVFELVDTQDRVVGRQLRAVVHAQGLLHRAGEQAASTEALPLNPRGLARPPRA